MALLLGAVGCARDHRDAELCAEIEEALPDAGDGEAELVPQLPAESAARSGLCDGSSELRLVVADRAWGKALAPQYFVSDQYGFRFLVVDGTCRYYAMRDLELGVATGQLGEEQLEELTRELALDRLASLPSSRVDCADHNEERLIATQDASLRCRCDVCPDAPASTDAIVRAGEWIERLADSGAPLSGPVSALAVALQPPDAPDRLMRPVLRWPLESPPEHIPGLIKKRGASRDRGAHFESSDADALRRLRVQTHELAEARGQKQHSSYPTIFVSDCVETYELVVRDELPAALGAQLHDFLPMAWKRPKLALCASYPELEPTDRCDDIGLD